LNVNQVIGKRLAGLEVNRKKRERFIEKMGWQSQTYYEARSGRRVFRVGELAAMAAASGLQAWQFVDARGLTKSVILEVGSKSTISTAALLDVFGYTREASAWQALISVRESLGELNGAVLHSRRAEEVLRAVHPSLPAYEWEDKL
jgi:hypothetical protein